jgi:hypothetical protein
LVGAQVHAVELLGQLEHRGIAALAHILDDGGDDFVDLERGLALGAKQSFKALAEIGLA